MMRRAAWITVAALVITACSEEPALAPVDLAPVSNGDLCIMVVEQPELTAAVERELMNREATCFWGVVRKTLEERQRESIRHDPMLIAYYQAQGQEFPMSGALYRLRGQRKAGCFTEYTKKGIFPSCSVAEARSSAHIKFL